MSWFVWCARASWVVLGLLLVLWVSPWTPLREVEVVSMLVAPDVAIGVGMVLVSAVLAVLGIAVITPARRGDGAPE